MGNLESTEGAPGEPPSVSLLPPPGKMPMPEPCELEERFALVLVSAEPAPPRPPTDPGLGAFPGNLGRSPACRIAPSRTSGPTPQLLDAWEEGSPAGERPGDPDFSLFSLVFAPLSSPPPREPPGVSGFLIPEPLAGVGAGGPLLGLARTLPLLTWTLRWEWVLLPPRTRCLEERKGERGGGWQPVCVWGCV